MRSSCIYPVTAYYSFIDPETVPV